MRQLVLVLLFGALFSFFAMCGFPPRIDTSIFQRLFQLNQIPKMDEIQPDSFESNRAMRDQFKENNSLTAARKELLDRKASLWRELAKIDQESMLWARSRQFASDEQTPVAKDISTPGRIEYAGGRNNGDGAPSVREVELPGRVAQEVVVSDLQQRRKAMIAELIGKEKELRSLNDQISRQIAEKRSKMKDQKDRQDDILQRARERMRTVQDRYEERADAQAQRMRDQKDRMEQRIRNRE